MKRIDLSEAVLQGWRRLSAEKRERFFVSLLKAALRLDALSFRAWVLKRLKTRPLAAPVHMSRLLADTDIALAIRAVREAPGEFAAGLDRDKAHGG